MLPKCCHTEKRVIKFFSGLKFSGHFGGETLMANFGGLF